MPDSDLVTLDLPPGEWTWSFPVSHNDQSWQPYPNGRGGWSVDVPRDVAGPLLHNGGFVMAQTAQPTVVVRTAGMVRMRHPEHTADNPKSFGWSPAPGIGGVLFEPDEEGVIEIPVEAVPIAQEAHGFVPAPPKPVTASEQAPKEPEKSAVKR